MVFADKNVRTKAQVVETEPVFQITPAAASLCAVLRGFFSSAFGIFMQKKSFLITRVSMKIMQNAWEKF